MLNSLIYKGAAITHNVIEGCLNHLLELPFNKSSVYIDTDFDAHKFEQTTGFVYSSLQLLVNGEHTSMNSSTVKCTVPALCVYPSIAYCNLWGVWLSTEYM